MGRQKWIDKARAQTDKMTELVNDLVILSRLDEGRSRPYPNAVLTSAVRFLEAADSFRASAEAQGHALELNIVPGLTYYGDEYAVRQLVSILLDNAIKIYRCRLPDSAFFVCRGKRGPSQDPKCLCRHRARTGQALRPLLSGGQGPHQAGGGLPAWACPLHGAL